MEIDYSKRLYSLLNSYVEEKIDTEYFSEEFTAIYDLYVDYNTLNSLQLRLFGELSDITSRFSPFAEDLEKYDCYFDENDVKKKAMQIFKELN